MYDIAVIGLGPAGATLARLLDGRFSVLALDRKRPPGQGGFSKPCGGLLAPDAQHSLARFGLTLPLGVLVDPQIFSVRTIDIPSRRTRHYQRFYINLDRHALDLWLKSLIPPHVDVRDGAQCTGVLPCAGGYDVTWKEQGEERRAQARYVVGADGAASLVRRLVCPGAPMRAYTAVQQWFEDAHQSPFYSCIFDPELTDCYAWGLTKGERFILGGAFEPHNARQKFERLKDKLAAFGFALGAPVKTEACRVLRPAGWQQMRCGRGTALLVGEAAGFISPSSLEGLSYAFDSARLLGRVLNRTLQRNAPAPDKAYARATLPLRLKLLGKIVKSPVIYHPFLRRLVMRSGVQSIEVEDTALRR